MCEELTHSHGKRLISGCVGYCVWREKGPMFTLLIFKAVATRIFDDFVKRVEDLSTNKCINV